MELNSNGVLQPSEYTILKSLGKGVFGEVFKASKVGGNLVALKRLPKNGIKFDWKLVNREVDVGKRLKVHEGIVQLESYFETVTNVYFVFEFVDGMDLFTMMENIEFQPLPERTARHLIKQIVDSLLFCHSRRVAHRDIKLDNIIIDKNNKTKIIDFGLASMDEDEKGCQTFVGSPEYVPPEIIKREPYSGYKADVYSLGMVLYCIIFGQFPFIPEQRFQAIFDGEPHPILQWPDRLPHFPIIASDAVKDLISKMLDIDPGKRISMEEVANHKWLQNEFGSELPLMTTLREGIDVC